MTTMLEGMHAKLTAKGSFYERNGGCFKGMNRMTREEELEYLRTEFTNPKSTVFDSEPEWIEHHGKGYPDLPMDTLVQVRFGDGGESGSEETVEYWTWNWRHDWGIVGEDDITHYRVVTK